MNLSVLTATGWSSQGTYVKNGAWPPSHAEDIEDQTLGWATCVMDNLPVGATSAYISRIDVSWDGKSTNAAENLSAGLFYDGGYIYGTHSVPTSWTSYVDTLTKPGAGWAYALVNSATITMGKYASVNWAAWGPLVINVYWELPTGSWTSLVRSLIGPVVGAAMMLQELPKLLRCLARENVLVSGADALRMFHELCSDPHRVVLA